MATKTPDGRISLSGYVASADMKDFVVHAGEVSADTTEIASGEPVGFVGDVLAGLEALGHLTTGTVKFEANAWTLAGTPRTEADANLAVAALSTAADPAAWRREIDAPTGGPAPEPAPEATPTPPADAAPATRHRQNAPEPEQAPPPRRLSSAISSSRPASRSAARWCLMVQCRRTMRGSISRSLPATCPPTTSP